MLNSYTSHLASLTYSHLRFLIFHHPNTNALHCTTSVCVLTWGIWSQTPTPHTPLSLNTVNPRSGCNKKTSNLSVEYLTPNKYGGNHSDGGNHSEINGIIPHTKQIQVDVSPTLSDADTSRAASDGYNITHTSCFIYLFLICLIRTKPSRQNTAKGPPKTLARTGNFTPL